VIDLKNRKRNLEERAGMSKYNPVPLYRSYGKTKKEYKWWEDFLVFIQKAFTVFLLGITFFAIGVAAAAWFQFGGLMVQTLIIAVTSLIVFFIYTKTLRKRLSLNKKLKKVCVENHFDLTFERSLFDSLRWSENETDITVITKNHIFYVRLLAVPKYRCRLYFNSATEISVLKPPPNNKFSVIFGFKAKTKTFKLDFSNARDFEGKKTHKIILVNPVCEEMYYKVSQNSSVQTGNGGEHFGYQVFTASGFVNFLSRIERTTDESLH
jgi:hypothetical protein